MAVLLSGGPAQWRSMSAVVRLCVGPCLWRSMPADAALSEKSPHLGSAQARLSLSKNPKVQPEDLRGRDRSPSGPALQTMASFKRNFPIYGVFACEFCVRIQRCEDFLPVTPSSKSKNASDIKVTIKNVEKDKRLFERYGRQKLRPSLARSRSKKRG